MENLTIKILNREYQISCPTQAKANLQQAVTYLNDQLAKINQSGKIMSFESMLVTCAINLSYELIEKNIQQTSSANNLVQELTCLKQKLHNALEKTTNYKSNQKHHGQYSDTDSDIDSEIEHKSSNKMQLEYNSSEN